MKRLILSATLICCLLISCESDSGRMARLEREATNEVRNNAKNGTSGNPLLDSLNKVYIKFGVKGFCEALEKDEIFTVQSYAYADKKFGLEQSNTSKYREFQKSKYLSLSKKWYQTTGISRDQLGKDRFFDGAMKSRCAIDSKAMVKYARTQIRVELGLEERVEYEYNASKYSNEAVATARKRIAKWINDDLIKLELADNKAYVANLLWQVANVDQKKELLTTILIYAAAKSGNDEAFDFYNYQTGKQIASSSRSGEINFEY